MRKTFWYIVGGQLATISIPAMAQDAPMDPAPDAQVEPAPAPSTGSNAADAAEMAGWPADQRQAYDAWPVEAQDYFWTLTPERKALFFRLRDTDRLTLLTMDEAGRAEAWAMIESRAAVPPPESEAPALEEEPGPG